MLEYTFDPRPDQLQRRYRIERGGLVNIDDLCAIAGTAEQSAQMRYAVSKAAMELIRDPTCEAIEGEARKNGEEFIRVPIYFKNMHPITLLGGRARIILPISLVLLKDEYGRQGEEDWIIGLESDLAVPAALGPLQTISRFSARQHMRSLIAGELGQESEFDFFYRTSTSLTHSSINFSFDHTFRFCNSSSDRTRTFCRSTRSSNFAPKLDRFTFTLQSSPMSRPSASFTSYRFNRSLSRNLASHTH